MFRTLAGTLAGYIFMGLVLAVALSFFWWILGMDFAFRPGTLELTLGWMLLSMPVHFGAAFAGGWMSVHVAGKGRAAAILAVVILALGSLVALHQLRQAPLSPDRQEEILAQGRSGGRGNLAVGQHAQQPPWYAFALPLLGAAGVATGGRLRLGDGG